MIDTVNILRAHLKCRDLPNFSDYLLSSMNNAPIACMENALVYYYEKSIAEEVKGGLSMPNYSPIYSYHLRSHKNNTIAVAGVEKSSNEFLYREIKRLKGRYLWGGHLMHHFGHFMSESTHRMYSAILGCKYDGIIFAGRHPLHPWMIEMFEKIYKCKIPIYISDEKTFLIDELMIYPQACILGGGNLYQDYSDFLFNIVNQSLRFNSNGDKLFIGRIHLNDGTSLIGEEYLYAELERDGFQYFIPENYPITEQFKKIINAKLIVMVGGSASHIFDHLGPINADLLLIGRGDGDIYYHHKSIEGKVRLFATLDKTPEDIIYETNVNNRFRARIHYDGLRLANTFRSNGFSNLEHFSLEKFSQYFAN